MTEKIEKGRVYDYVCRDGKKISDNVFVCGSKFICSLNHMLRQSFKFVLVLPSPTLR